MRKVLVTGATGFIGKNLVELLREKNVEVIAYVLENDPGIPWLRENGVNQFVYEWDLDKQAAVDVDACIHLASYGVKYTDKDISLTADINIKLACRILQFCAANGCKLFITAGSGFEYGQQAEARIPETAAVNPEDIYAASKVAAETILRVLAPQLEVKFLICRPFNVYGKYEPAHRLLPLIYTAAESGKVLDMTAGMQKRDYLYVKDVVNGFYEVAVNHENFVSGEAINICSGEECYLKDFIYAIADANGFDRKLFNLGAVEYRKNESMYFVGDNTKLLTRTGWQQKYPFKKAITDYNLEYQIKSER